MGYSKFHLFFQIVAGLALLYEAANRAPKLYGKALVLANEVGEHYEDIEGLAETPDVMANGFLEHVYNGAAAPQWMEDLKLMALPLTRG